MDLRNKPITTFGSSSYLVWLGFFGLALVAVVLYLGFHSQYIAQSQKPQIRAIYQYKFEVTIGHLWLEEILSGDRNENIDSVFTHFKTANDIYNILSKGGVYDQMIIPAFTDSTLIKKLDSCQLMLDSLSQLGVKRYNEIETSYAGTSIDQIYDQTFIHFIDQVTEIENRLIRERINNLNEVVIFQKTLIIIVISFAIVFFLTLILFEKYRNKNQAQLIQLNEQLQEELVINEEVQEELSLSQDRYRDLFKNAPISLWEEDFTELSDYLAAQLKQYNLPIEELFEKHPEVLIKCSELAKVIDVNNYTLDLYEAESKEELIGSIDKIFTSNSFNVFKNSLIALHQEKKYFNAEGKNKTLTGKELSLFLRWSFVKQDASKPKKVIVSVLDLTELHKTEQELNASENRFQAIFDNDHTVMLIIEPETGKFIDVNKAAVNYYGYSKETLTGGMTAYDLNTLTPEETQTRIEEAKSKKVRFFNFSHRLANGKIHEVEVYSGPLIYQNKTRLLSIVHDVTEKRKAENALFEAKNKMESIFRAAPTGIGVVSNRLITDVNQRFCEIVGYSKKELLGKESIIVYPSKEEFEWVGKEKYEQIKEKGTGTVETKFKRKDGRIIDVLLSSTPIDLNDLSKGVTFTALDISKRVEDLREIEKHRFHLEEIVKDRTAELENSQLALLNLVDDLNKQSEKLEQTNSRLADINEELETFTYSVSHDLKAPLRGIDGYSQLLLEDVGKDLPAEAWKFLENIRKSTQQMNLLIEDLLSYSRLERRDFIHEPLRFGDIVVDILHQYQAEIEADKIKIITKFQEDLMIDTDKESLLMVMRNLVDNAVKFSAKSVHPKIEIGSKQNSAETIIFVKDNGVGFDMKYHDRIFKIFQRLHLAEEYQGTGIGLAMVNKAVQRMKGSIWAESKLGEGACFYVKIGK